MSNQALKEVFQDLHAMITKDVNPDSIIDALLSKKVISFDHYDNLRLAQSPVNRCRDLLSLLYRSSHPETFIHLREALRDEYNWIVEKIDEQLPSVSARLRQLNLGYSTYDTGNCLLTVCKCTYLFSTNE